MLRIIDVFIGDAFAGSHSRLMWKLRSGNTRNQKFKRRKALNIHYATHARRFFFRAAFAAMLCLAARASAQQLFPFEKEFSAGDSDALRVEATKTKDNGCIIKTGFKETADEAGTLRIHIQHPVFRIEAIDLTGDGRAELCVGVVKRTRYDSAERKRLFVYRITARSIRPLWLGSHLGGMMEDFRLIHTDSGPRILAVVREAQPSRYYIAVWKWSRFGPVFERYAARFLSLQAAMNLCTEIATEPA
jgi:hypothetical protein